ncbi:hypothetical protein PCO87_03845 [Pectobacteriaceae bacterium C52]|nr:hypothetical protein PCO87_03845 [Pectobacteriaceae bacterium C52]
MKKLHMIWMIGVSAIFILYNVDAMWSSSADLAHHYALAYRISEQWTLVSHSDPTLGEMNIYPRGSHIIAAIIGVLVNSTFLGIQLTTLISFSLLWLSAIYILNGLPSYARTIALITALALVMVNHFVFKFDLHGHEIVGNFFYAQLVGHAFLFLSMVFAISIEKKNGVLWAIVALVPLMFFVAIIHLLPALEILGLIVGLIAVLVFTEYQNGRVGVRILIFATAMLLISIGTIVLHPSFAAMRAISGNNGSLELSNITYPVGFLTLCFFVLTTSIILFIQWARLKDGSEFLAAKYFSIYGAATAGLCLLQYALTFFGQGSEYAVKKYVFGLTTVLLLQLSVMLSMAITKTKPKSLGVFGSKFDGEILNTIVLFILSFSALFLNVPATKTLDVSNIVSMEKRLTNLVDLSLPLANEGKSNVIIGLNGFPNIVNYLFSISIAKTPKNLAVQDVLIKNSLTQPKNYSYIISSSSNKMYGSIGCRSISSGDISIIEAQCFENRLKSAENCHHPFDFTLDGSVPERLLKGFSGAESHGRWTDGAVARFECVAGGSVFKTVKLEITPFLYGSLHSQRLQVSVNGKDVYQGNFFAARNSNNPLVIDLSRVPAAETYTLSFKMPDATSPKEVGFNEDGRKLGFSFKKYHLINSKLNLQVSA